MATADSDNGEELAKRCQESSNEQQKLDQNIIDQVENSNIPKKEKEQMIASLSMYSGPIPAPELLAGYEALDKGASQKIIDNALAESEQRRKLEISRQKRRGRMAWFSLLAVILFIFGTGLAFVYLVLKGHPYIGTGSGIFSLITLLGSLSDKVSELSGNDDLTNNKDHDNIN